jgi:hypothetical protein
VLHVHALGLRAQAEALLGELDAAEATLARCAAALREQGELTVPQYMRSQYLRSRLLGDVARLERAEAGARRAAARRARRSGRRAARSVAWVAARRPRSIACSGAPAGAGRAREAGAWRERSLAEAERLGAQPDFARTASGGRLLRGLLRPARARRRRRATARAWPNARGPASTRSGSLSTGTLRH